MSSLKYKESLAPDSEKLQPLGEMNKTNGSVTLVKVTIDPEFTPIIPVFVPNLEAVRALASELHVQKTDWQGTVFGWEGEYHASRAEQPEFSKMTFTPAEFWIGDATIWGFSMMWEDGDDQPASEAVSDWNLIENAPTGV